MPSNLFIVQPDRELAPYASAQKKQSAASGQREPAHQLVA